jgi:hypothetical protein
VLVIDPSFIRGCPVGTNLTTVVVRTAIASLPDTFFELSNDTTTKVAHPSKNDPLLLIRRYLQPIRMRLKCDGKGKGTLASCHKTALDSIGPGKMRLHDSPIHIGVADAEPNVQTCGLNR